MLAQAKTNTESAEAAVPKPKLPKVSEPKALSVSCVACVVCVCVFADEKVAELLTKIDMPIFVWLQAIWSSEKQHPSLLLAVDVAWHSMARSGHSRAGQGYVYVKAAVFGKPMRPKDRTEKELIELIHQVQLEGLSGKSKLCIESHPWIGLPHSFEAWSIKVSTWALSIMMYHVGFLKPPNHPQGELHSRSTSTPHRKRQKGEQSRDKRRHQGKGEVWLWRNLPSLGFAFSDFGVSPSKWRCLQKPRSRRQLQSQSQQKQLWSEELGLFFFQKMKETTER